VRYCENVPNDNWWLVISGGEGGTTVQTAYHLHGIETPKQRYCAGGTWSGWFDLNKDYLPLTGGTVTAQNYLPLGLKNANGNNSYVQFEGKDGVLGYIGFESTHVLRLLSSVGGFLGDILHTGNYSAYALPKTGGEITANSYTILRVNNTHEASPGVEIGYLLRGESLGAIGFHGADNPVVTTTSGNQRTIHHDGNSAKVAIQASAPSDTSALWVY